MVQRAVPDGHVQENEREKKKGEAEVTDHEVEREQNTEREVEIGIAITRLNHQDHHIDLKEIEIEIEKGNENTAADDIDSGYLHKDDVKTCTSFILNFIWCYKNHFVKTFVNLNHLDVLSIDVYRCFKMTHMTQLDQL